MSDLLIIRMLFLVQWWPQRTFHSIEIVVLRSVHGTTAALERLWNSIGRAPCGGSISSHLEYSEITKAERYNPISPGDHQKSGEGAHLVLQVHDASWQMSRTC